MAKMRLKMAKRSRQEGQEEAQEGQEEAQEGEDEAQQGQEEGQDGQDEAREGQEEAQEGQEEAKIRRKRAYAIFCTPPTQFAYFTLQGGPRLGMPPGADTSYVQYMYIYIDTFGQASCGPRRPR